jgi:hypothetical protein
MSRLYYAGLLPSSQRVVVVELYLAKSHQRDPEVV